MFSLKELAKSFMLGWLVNILSISQCAFKACDVDFYWRPVGIGDSRAKTTGSHVALRAPNSGAESGRELFKGSKDTASLLVYTRKKFFGWGVRVFWRDFRPPWLTSPDHGPNPLDGSIALKFLLQTRLQCESFDTSDDLLGFQVQKLWCKVIKMCD